MTEPRFATTAAVGHPALLLAMLLAPLSGCDDKLELILDDLSLRGERYCEVLVIQTAGDPIVADVYNSYGLNDCPDAEWNALDTDALAQELGAARVVLNGPRYWAVDDIGGDVATGEAKTFGGIEMRKGVTVTMPLSATMAAYEAREIARSTTFSFFEEREVYELRDPMGAIYVMQSFSTQTDTTQTLSALPLLAQRLTLPSGWTFSVNTLSEPRDVGAKGMATVVQDNFGNAYQKYDAP